MIIVKNKRIALSVSLCSVLLLMITITMISNTPEDRTVAEQILQDAQQFKGISQSHSHLVHEDNAQKFKTLGNLDLRSHIIKQALTREVEMAQKGYAVFYTAVPYMRLFQDVTRKEYKAVVGKVGALQEKAFHFIRYTYDDQAYMQYKDATDFLVKELTETGIIDDNLSRLKTILVSTNLAFFGNLGWKEESTYFYFNNPQSWAKANPEWLSASLKSFGYSPEFVEELLPLAKESASKAGELFQIFVPLEMVNSAGYISWRQGIPFDRWFIETVFKRTYLTYNPLVDANFSAFHNSVFAAIAEYKKKYKERDPATVALTDYLITNARNGKYYLFPFLSEYKQGAIPDADLYQARLVIGKWLLDPTMGVKIYRYSTLDAAQERQYKDKLKAIFKRMEEKRTRPTMAKLPQIPRIKIPRI